MTTEQSLRTKSEEAEMAELVTVYRVDTDEAKQLIAEKYGVKPEDVKFWNGKFEFQKPGEQK